MTTHELQAWAETLRPTTLAAIIADMAREQDEMPRRIAEMRQILQHALVDNVGVDEARELVADAAD